MSTTTFQTTLEPCAAHLWQLLHTKNLAEKITLARTLNTLPLCAIRPIAPDQLNGLRFPQRPDHFQTVAPRQVPKRRFNDPLHRAHFLHAIAAIELFAVELPALALLRFGSTDLEFIATQRRIIAEEAQHFSLLAQHLQSLGLEFGPIPTHQGLWDYAWRCESLLDHQIVIPCYLEARGLDVSPEFVTKLRLVGDEAGAQIMQLIVDEEIDHVRQGMSYLAHEAQKIGLSKDELFEQTLRKYFGSALRSKVPLDHKLRQQAGFTAAQLQLLTTGVSDER